MKTTVTALPRFRTQWDLNDPAIGCPSIGVSLTVPDESYSIRDILTKFTRMPDVVNPNLVYDFDEMTDADSVDMDADVITSFGDLSDFDMMTDRVVELKYQIQNEKEARKQARDEKAKSSSGEAGTANVSVV